MPANSASKKVRKQNAKFFRTLDFSFLEGETQGGTVFDADAGAGRGDSASSSGQDVIATAQTGTGKTLAFLIPVIEKLPQHKTAGIAALVLVPTRELAMQVVAQYDALRGKQSKPAALVVGGLPEGRQLNAIRKGARLVVATPGRLEDYSTASW